MMKRPTFGTHPLDEFRAVGTSVLADRGDEEMLLCECCSEFTAQGIVDVLRYHNHVATQFSWTGPTPPKLRIIT
jgi:hypothetical protein